MGAHAAGAHNGLVGSSHMVEERRRSGRTVEDECLREIGVVGAEGEVGVVHVLVEEFGVVVVRGVHGYQEEANGESWAWMRRFGGEATAAATEEEEEELEESIH
ncbi:hypothetical protein CDL15_Pgr004013 [Punica granatum]|uniref:Uncharacterized protein n=1 Tax=Punica granatum TaxID=22663 RepID=A0A218XF90_PUNGR|nr:hypothetical protein CDL15_Pgr004013 [Punica granatum]